MPDPTSEHPLCLDGDGSQPEVPVLTGRIESLSRTMAMQPTAASILCDFTATSAADLTHDVAGAHQYTQILLRDDGRIDSWNDAALTITGYAENQALGQPLSLLTGNNEKRSSSLLLDLELADRKGYSCSEYLMKRQDGGCLIGKLIITPVHDGRGRLSGFSCLIHDIGILHKVQSQLVAERQRFVTLLHAANQLYEEKEAMRTTLASISDGVIATDAVGTISFLNPVAEQLTGWSCDEARGRPVQQVLRLVRDNGDETHADPVSQALRDGKPVTLDDDAILISRDGRRFAIADCCSPVLDKQQHITGAVLVFRDVTESRSRALEVQYQATHDALTGLVNRIEFERRLERVLQTASPDESHVLFYLDLDRFKNVNDRCGHLAGDALLKRVAAILKSCVRHRDTLARLGGDEFAVLLEHCLLDQARRVAECIRSVMLEEEFGWQGNLFAIGVSIGVLPLNARSWTATQALAIADSACYAAKSGLGNGICVHEADYTETDGHTGLRYWEYRIQRAIADNGLRLFFQPIVPVGSSERAALHGEVLLRIDDHDGLVTATEFLDAAERNGQLIDIDRWVVRNVISSLNTLQPPLRSGDIMVSVNISAPSLSSNSFQDFVMEQLERLTLPMASLCFEIHESAASGDPRATQRFAERLRRRHCHLAVDDFGTGLSSFGSLRTLPVDYLKINGRFIREMSVDPIDEAMVGAIHNISRLLDIRTVAASVETSAMLARVRALGLDYAQGFGVSYPTPFEAALRALTPA